jgi:hypothetical protein
MFAQIRSFEPSKSAPCASPNAARLETAASHRYIVSPI